MDKPSRPCQTLQNIAFIVAAELTYIASVLAIVATGPLFSAGFSALLLGEKVPRHTWLASLSCTGFVVIIYMDSLTEQTSARHFQVRCVRRAGADTATFLRM